MKTVQGDLLKLAQQGHFDLIVHGCNCFGNMGAGIAKGIKIQFSAAYQADLATEKGDESKLGTISFAEVQTQAETSLVVVNGYTQYQYRGRGQKVDYEAVRGVFSAIKTQFPGKRIGYPAIGAGLGGGDWTIISAIIEEELSEEDHTFVEFVPS